MRIDKFEEVIPDFMKRLEKDGHSQEVLSINRWIIEHFIITCHECNVSEISMDTIICFLKVKYNVDLYRPKCGTQTSIRRPLLILWEFIHTGTYKKSHLYEKSTVPEQFIPMYQEYCDYLNSLALNVKTKASKARYIKQFFDYLNKIYKLESAENLDPKHIYSYLNEKEKVYTATTMNTIKYNLRGFLDWLSINTEIEFDGKTVFPKIRTSPRRIIPSCYSKTQISKLLDCVDVSSKTGKHDYLVLALSVFYGLRISDIISLKLSNINWSKNKINIVQQKTMKPLILPLIDDVKYPLIDYLKNSRPAIEDDHILLTLCAPYTRYAKNSSLQRIVTKYMKKAEIDYSNKHHGTHALRHSLAVGMLNENIPISSISGVLGHSTLNTTNLYLTFNEFDFKKISLEVPDVSK